MVASLSWKKKGLVQKGRTRPGFINRPGLGVLFKKEPLSLGNQTSLGSDLGLETREGLKTRGGLENRASIGQQGGSDDRLLKEDSLFKAEEKTMERKKKTFSQKSLTS